MTASDYAAHVVPLDQQANTTTSFTRELLDLIRTGVPGGPEWLTLGALYPHLRSRVQSRVLPTPNKRGIDTADQFPFTRNAALRAASHKPVSQEVPRVTGHAVDPEDRPGKGRHSLALLIEAERIARTLKDPKEQVEVLAAVAKEVAAYDAHRAAALVGDCEHLAYTIPHSVQRGSFDRGQALAKVAEAAAVFDLDRALRIADTNDYPDDGRHSIGPLGLPAPRGYPGRKASTLAKVVAAIPDVGEAMRIALTIQEPQSRAEALMAVASKDPDSGRALALLIEAVPFVYAVDVFYRGDVLADMTAAVAVHDPVEAARIARTIPEDWKRVGALAVVASKDPDGRRALALLTEAASVARDSSPSGALLVEVAEAAAVHDLQDALRIAHTIDAPESRVSALIQIATGPQPMSRGTRRSLLTEAERLSRAIQELSTRAHALGAVVVGMASHDLAPIEDIVGALQQLEDGVWAEGDVARKLAARDPVEAARIARTIPHPYYQAWALADVAEAAAARDPVEAARIARTIPDAGTKALALVKVAAFQRRTRRGGNVESEVTLTFAEGWRT